MKNTLYVLSYAKSTSWAKTTQIEKKMKPVAVVIVKLCQSEDISQLPSQSISRNIFRLILTFLKAYFVVTNTAPLLSGKNCGWFLGDIILWACLLLRGPYYVIHLLVKLCDNNIRCVLIIISF